MVAALDDAVAGWKALLAQGLGEARFRKIEGVADREPYNPEDGFDPRNRRMSIILGWS